MKLLKSSLRACFALTILILQLSAAKAQYNKTVAKDGSGDYTTVQAAIDAAPTNSVTPYVIYIKNGKYVELVNIPGNKPFIQLIGQSLAQTIISYDNYSGKAIPGGGTYGTANSATVTISANDCMLMNLSIENSTAYGIDANAVVPAPGDGPQALALNVTSDRVVFYNCRFNGGQDTIYAGGVGKRHYFKNCYVDGNTDFLFGDATAIFDTCVIYPRTRLDNSAGGYVTAVNTKAASGYGYVFRDCKLSKNRGSTFYTLGRPWQNDAATADASKSRNKVAFLNTIMGSTISAAGWSIWDAGTVTGYITDVEYNSLNYSGTAVDISNRVAWSQQLNSAQAAKFYNNDTVFMNANTPQTTQWNPFTTWPVLTASTFQPELSVSNFIGKKGASTSTFNWNLSWPVNGVACDVYRSSDKINFSKITTLTSTEDSACNFTYTEANPPAGSTYYYLVRASKTGYVSITSDTTNISSTPTITTTGTLSSFSESLGTPSANQVFVVSGANLTNNLVITAPANFEISSDGGTTWYDNTSSITLIPSSNTISNTNINVRLNSSSTGSFSGNIVLAATGAATVNVAAGGTVTNAALYTATLLQQWPLTISNVDSASVRSAYLTATTPTLKKLYVSNGTTVPTIPAYSPIYGMAYGASSNGDGTWSTAVGGTGGNLNRTNYVQYNVTAAAGSANVRVDSIVLAAAFYNSSSSTKLAVVYSLTNFVSDSADVTGGSGPAGILVSGATGAFTGPIVLANQTAGPTNTYRLALNSSSGITLSPSQTLTIRIYNSCGSTSAGRYGMMKNIQILGSAPAGGSSGGSGYSLTNIAFPGAEGYGKYTTGGRGTNVTATSVFTVTSLADDGSAGTLRWALTQTASYRTIVFKVSGTIHLLSKLQITKPNTTIAGQTAPGDGICLADYPVQINADNVIVRYLRFRMGDKNENKGLVNGSGGDDSFDDASNSHKYIIIDHCTMSWSNDEACTFYGGDSLSLQWNMISEPLNYSYHFETGDADYEHHGYGGIWGGQHASFHHNLFAHCKSRTPRFNGNRTGYSENADFRNNVIYNWGDYQTYGGEGGNYNIVNNYYKYGPSTPTAKKSIFLQPYNQASPVIPYGQFYVNGNYIDANATVTNNNWSGVDMNNGTAADTTSAKALTAFSFSTVTTQIATDAYSRIMDSVGVIFPRRDTLDQRIISDVKNRTGALIDVQGGYPHLTAYSSTVNAWPALNSFTPAVDTDGDGMPDWWENKKGLNPNDPSDRSTVASDGYTMIEEYLNAIPSADAQVNFDSIGVARNSQLISTLTFKINWPKTLYTFGLYRSTDNITFTKVLETTCNADSIRFRLSDSTTPYSTVYYKIGSYKTSSPVDTVYSAVITVDNTNNFYNKSSLDITLNSSWNSKADGSGVAPIASLSQVNGNFHVQNSVTLSGALNLLLSNLTVENNATLTLGSGGALTLGPISSLTINSGSAVNLAGYNLTLQSSSAGTASINQLDVAGSRLLNATNVTVQRYIGGNLSWRTIGFPFTAATNIIGAGGGNTSLNAYVASPATAYWFNESGDNNQYGAGNATPNAGWTAFTNSTSISSSKGILIWGAASPNTLSLNGAVNTGLQSIALTKNVNGWSVVANPFPAAISWTSICNNASNNTVLGANTAAMYRVNPLGNGSYSFSSFIPAANGTASAGVGTNGGSDVIENGASFFVQAAVAGNLGILEADKTTNTTSFTSGGISLFGTTPGGADADNGMIRLALSNNQNNYSDEVLLRWNSHATDVYDAAYDAYDLGTFNAPDLSVIDHNNTRYSIFTGSALVDATTENRTFKLGLNTLSEGAYHLKANTINSLAGNNQAFITDNYTHTTTLIADSTVIDFTVTADALSKADGRLSVVLNTKTATAIDDNSGRFKLLSNPSKGNSFSVYSSANYADVKWRVTDIVGKTVDAGSFGQVLKASVHKASITATTASGIYFIQLRGDGGKMQTIKWIKQ